MIESFKLPVIIPETVSGSIVSFNDEYGGLPLKSCTSLISGYQEGSGTSSPSNVRPLHAWSGANLSACGVNLWNGEYTPNTWISETSTGATAPHTGTGVTDYIPIVGGTSFYKFDTGSSRASYFDSNKNCIGGGIAVASAASAALGAISEDDSILGKSLIFVGLAEGIALYGLIIAFMILSKI